MSLLQRGLQWLGVGTAPRLQRQLAALESQLAQLQRHQHDAQQALLERFDAARAQQRELDGHLQEQRQELDKLRRQLADTMKKEAINAAQQVEAFLNLQAVLGGGASPLPPLHGWPVSPDLALHLAALLRSGRYGLVIEFGSGSSTLVIARLLQQLGQGRLLSLDHLPQFHRQTAQLLQDHGVDALVDLCLAPLIARTGSDGCEYRYYDCDAALAAAAARQLGSVETDALLVFVDGPPAATGPKARFPALEAVLAHFPHRALHLLLDDHIRQEEKDVVKAWEALLQRAGRRYTLDVLPLEKGAVLLRVEPPAPALVSGPGAAEGAGN